MALISFLLSLLLAAYTVLIEPFARTNFYRRLKKRLATDPSARLLYYRTQVLWEWSWVVVIAVIMIPSKQPFKELGLTLPNPIGWIFLGAMLLGIGMSIVLLRRNPGAMARMQQSLEPSSVLLPTTALERRWYAATAMTAGICEELLYRGFLMRFLLTILPGWDWILLAVLSGVIYGLGRAYQGWKGILQTTLTGFSFAVVYVLGGSLLPAMVFHALAELRILAIWEPKEKAKKTK